MKKILAIIIVLCTVCLSSCGVLKELKSGTDDAFLLAEEFCTALAKGDFDSAKEDLHPDATPGADELSSFVTTLEQTHEIDFSDGVAFKRRTGTSSTYYDSAYDGSVYEIEYEIVVGDVVAEFFFVVVKNDRGYGIYSFGVQ